jgi:hypothetical protein
MTDTLPEQAPICVACVGERTHGSSGGALGPVVLVILAVALPGPAVAAAAVALLHVLVIVAGVIVGAGAVSVGVAGLAVAPPTAGRGPHRAPASHQSGTGRPAAPEGAART